MLAVKSHSACPKTSGKITPTPSQGRKTHRKGTGMGNSGRSHGRSRAPTHGTYTGVGLWNLQILELAAEAWLKPCASTLAPGFSGSLSGLLQQLFQRSQVVCTFSHCFSNSRSKGGFHCTERVPKRGRGLCASHACSLGTAPPSPSPFPECEQIPDHTKEVYLCCAVD